jgi:hypothetical protein
MTSTYLPLAPEPPPDWSTDMMPSDGFAILITCDSEHQQIELLARFQNEGIQCRALIS